MIFHPEFWNSFLVTFGHSELVFGHVWSSRLVALGHLEFVLGHVWNSSGRTLLEFSRRDADVFLEKGRGGGYIKGVKSFS